jgi:hypothetical protein
VEVLPNDICRETNKDYEKKEKKFFHHAFLMPGTGVYYRNREIDARGGHATCQKRLPKVIWEGFFNYILTI